MSDLLRLKHLEHVGHYEDDGMLIVQVRSKQPRPEPCCLLAKTVKNGFWYGQRYRDEPNRRQTVKLELDRQKYKCKECKRNAIPEALPDIDGKHDMTKLLVTRIQRDAIEWPFSQAATVNGVTAKQVERIFKDHAEKTLRTYVPKFPRVLGMDEKHIHGRPRFIIGDIESRTMLDMQPSRLKLDLDRYFRGMPGANDVEVICQDMWRDYRDLNLNLFKNATIVIDKFHVQKAANSGMEFLRQRFQDDVSSRERVALKNKRKLFLGRWNKMKPRARSQLTALFTFFPTLKHAYEWKEAYYEIFDAETKEEANERMDQWRADLPREFQPYFRTARNVITVKTGKSAKDNWRHLILNYWDHPYTNAYAESLNNLIGRMNYQGVGYDLDTLRAKALLKHGVFKTIQWGEMVHIGRADYSVPMDLDVSLGVPLSTWEADLAAGTF